jgi:hypothetical protein
MTHIWEQKLKPLLNFKDEIIPGEFRKFWVCKCGNEKHHDKINGYFTTYYVDRETGEMTKKAGKCRRKTAAEMQLDLFG